MQDFIKTFEAFFGSAWWRILSLGSAGWSRVNCLQLRSLSSPLQLDSSRRQMHCSCVDSGVFHIIESFFRITHQWFGMHSLNSPFFPGAAVILDCSGTYWCALTGPPSCFDHLGPWNSPNTGLEVSVAPESTLSTLFFQYVSEIASVRKLKTQGERIGCD